MRASDFRRDALALPEAQEQETWGEATFRVRNKMFALLASDGATATLKASREQQAELLASSPDVFSVAPYVGRHGWVSVAVPAADREEVAELLEEAWRSIAPRAAVRERDK